MGALEAMWKRYEKHAAFYLVYIREAHPTDSRQAAANRREGILIRQPITFEARTDVAEQMCEKLEISLPTLIDGIDNRVGEAYSAWPDRMYVVGTDGKIAYKGRPGPAGFQPREVEQVLQRLFPEVNRSP